MKRAMLLLLLPAIAAAQAGIHPGNDAYDQRKLTFKGKLLEVVYRDLDGDGLCDVLVTHVSNEGGEPVRFLSIWFQRGDVGFGAEPDQTLELPREAAALALGHYTADPGTQILYFTGDGVWYLALKGKERRYATEAHRLFYLPTFFGQAQEDSIQLWSYPEDIDGNGLEDLVVPTPDAYKVFFQTAPGVYGKVLTLHPKGARAAERDVAGPLKGYLTFRKALPRILVKDFDGDKSLDFICQSEGRFQCFEQDMDHDFPPQPSREFDLSFWNRRKKKNSIETYQMMFEDLTGQGSLDMIVSYTEGEIGLFESISTRILVYRGQFGAPYKPDPDQQLHIAGISMNPTLVDVKGDGHLDLVVSSFRTDLMQGIRKAFLDSFTITYYVYFFNKKKGEFNKDPDISVDAIVKAKMIEKGRGMPMVRFDGEFDGDKLKDMLMVQEGPDETSELIVRLGQQKVGLFGRDFGVDEYIKRTIKPPGGIDLIDLNGDGKTDYVLRYPGHLEVNTSKKP